MASLAGLLKAAGHKVTGSDANVYPPMSTGLQEMGISYSEGYRPENLDSRPDIVVVGNVISRGNPELEEVLIRKLRYTSAAATIKEEFIWGRHSLAVAGTHGKTTTTSLLAWVMETAGLKPSFLIGGIAENFGRSFQLGDGKYFILEGDEYDTAFFDKGPKFLHYFPDAVILTSVEFDHADIYKDLDAVETAFKRLVNLVPQRGRIVAFDLGGDGASGDDLLEVGDGLLLRRVTDADERSLVRLAPGVLQGELHHAPEDGLRCVEAVLAFARFVRKKNGAKSRRHSPARSTSATSWQSLPPPNQ